MNTITVTKPLANIISVAARQKEDLGLSNRDISKKSGLSVSYVSRFLNGRVKNPFVKDIRLMAAALEFNVEISID